MVMCAELSSLFSKRDTKTRKGNEMLVSLQILGDVLSVF